jgi:CTP synthase
MHVTLVPFIETAGELKTKPTQHSVKEMREIGIQPDILICRTKSPLSQATKEKIALFSNVAVDAVISAIDVSCIYEVPLWFRNEALDDLIAERLNIWSRSPDVSAWQRIVERFTKPTKGQTRIGVVGKYVNLKDAYKSLHEALVHGGLANDCHVELEYIDSEQIEREGVDKLLAPLDAVLVPGGFGDRGTEGKIAAIKYARENKIPFFGICLGMQLAVVEFARHVAGLHGANSTEFDRDCSYPVIDLMPEQRTVRNKGATMRLGAYPCTLQPGTIAAELYGTTEISERHRHRYEFSNDYRDQLAGAGLVLSGTSPDKKLVEMIELREHPYFVGCQFHPEFKSRPVAAHPLFARFVRAALERQTVRVRGERKSAESIVVN